MWVFVEGVLGCGEMAMRALKSFFNGRGFPNTCLILRRESRMANRTVKDAKTVHGTNPQYLVEKIIRTRIYESRYWKEDCFALSAALMVDKGIELRYIGGIYGGNIKPTPFLCLTLKMLQIQPDKDIIIEFIRQEDFKYVRALGAFYLRLTGSSLDTWKYLEPLYNDFRKLRRMDRMGQFDVIHMDEFIDMLLREDRVFDVILPRLQKRQIHEENVELEPRVSILEEDLNNMNMSEDEGIEEERKKHEVERVKEKPREKTRRHKSRSPSSRARSKSRSPGHRRRSRSRDRDRRRRDRSRSREGRRKSRSRSPKPRKSKKVKTEDDEIAEANALRAKLGLKPLRP